MPSSAVVSNFSLSGTVTHPEGYSGLTPFVFAVDRVGSAEYDQSIKYFVWHEGTDPVDFAGPTSGEVFFRAGEASKPITIYVAGDTNVEGDEVFHVQLYDQPSQTTISNNDARGVILNDDQTAPPPSDGGRVIDSPGPGSHLQGGNGADTLNASQGPDVLTGGYGADTFAYKALPWNAGHVTDFVVGTDRLDLSALFQASGYAGSNPIADGYVSLVSDGSGGTEVLYDTDGPASGNTIQYRITDLDNVGTYGLTWAQLSEPTPPTSQTIGFAENTVSHREGDTGTTAFTFTVVRTGPIDQTASANWAVVGRSSDGRDPTEPSDFTGPTSGRVEFAPGETSKTLTVQVLGDTQVENDEHFVIALSRPDSRTGFALDHSFGVVMNDDPANPPASDGQSLRGDDSPGQALTGGPGNDTITAGHNSVVETGAGGADRFVFDVLPWNAGHVTDFTPGTDHVDLSALLNASHYTGSDPFADGYVSLQADGAGGTKVLFDTDGHGSGNTIQYVITDLDHVSPNQLSAGDFIFH